MSDLHELSLPIDARFIKELPPRGDKYVSHGVIAQYLIGKLKQVPKQEVVREIFEPDGTLSGVVLRLTVAIDGIETVVEEAGASSNEQSKTNGDRLKDSVSDAYKRCAMRMGLALGLWCGEESYFLDKVLEKP